MNITSDNADKMLIFNLYLNKFKLSKHRVVKNQNFPNCLYSMRNHPFK